MHKSLQLLSVLIVCALALVATACGKSKVDRVCSHLENLAEDEGGVAWEGDATCAESISEMEEACSDIFEESLDCVLEADAADDAAACLLACAFAGADL